MIIPNYNRAALVAETIQNMLSQTLPPAEVIVVDDGSTDGSVEAVRAFGDRVRLVQQKNQGPGAARNAGLAVARSEFIQFMDSDDLASLNKLQTQAELLEKTGADIAVSPWAKVYIEKNVVRLENHVLQNQLPANGVPLLHWFLRGWSTVFQTLLFRRSLLDRAGRYRTDLMPSEDSEYFVRILLQQPRTAFSDTALTLYRLHDQNQITASGTSRSKRILDWAGYLRRIMTDLDEAGHQLDRTTRFALQRSAYATLLEAQKLPQAPALEEARRLLEDFLRGISRCKLCLGHEMHRILGGLRTRVQRSRWISAYHAGPPTARQLQLIRDLGFEIGRVN